MMSAMGCGFRKIPLGCQDHHEVRVLSILRSGESIHGISLINPRMSWLLMEAKSNVICITFLVDPELVSKRRVPS